MIIGSKTLQAFLAASLFSSGTAYAARLGRKWNLEIVWNETSVVSNNTNLNSNNTIVGEEAKLGFCEGICAVDDDCQGTLICIEVPYEDSERQKCTLDVASLNLSVLADASLEAPEMPATDMGNMITVDGEEIEDSMFISNETAIISKQGSVSPKTIRYCARRETEAPTDTPTVPPSDAPVTAAPTTACPTTLEPSAFPSTLAPTTQSPTDAPVAIWPIPQAPEPKAAKFVGNPPPDDYLLQRCEGDCDNDNDCADGLVCRNRNGGEEVVGCVFDNFFSNANINDDTDFCVQPDPHRNMRLRLYWEPGYVWQESTSEMYFCLSHGWGVGNDLSCPFENRYLEEDEEEEPESSVSAPKKIRGSSAQYERRMKNDNKDEDDDKNNDDDKNRDDDDKNRDDDDKNRDDDDKNNDDDKDKWKDDACDNNEMCWYGEYQRPCDPNRIYLDTCSGSDRRQRFDFLYQSTGEVLIRAASRNKCLKGGRPRLTDCDPTDVDQRWMPGNGSFGDFKFEISRIGHEDRCITNHHHPKEKEIIEMAPCENERRFDTSFWEMY